MRPHFLGFMLLLATVLHGQSNPTPFDCELAATFTAASTTSVSYYNVGPTAPCVAWRLTYSTINATGVSIELQGTNNLAGATAPAPDPAGWVNLTPVAPTSNPAIGLTSGSIVGCCDYYPWIRVIATTFTGPGTQTMRLTLLGYKGTSAANGGGGGGALAGSLPTVVISGQNLLIGGNCVVGSPCKVLQSTVTALNTSGGGIDTLTAGTGSSYVWMDPTANFFVTDSGLTTACSPGCTEGLGVGFPNTDAFPVAICSATAAVWTGCQILEPIANIARDLTSGNLGVTRGDNVDDIECLPSTTGSLGCVEVGANLSVDINGVLSAAFNSGYLYDDDAHIIPLSAGQNTQEVNTLLTIPNTATPQVLDTITVNAQTLAGEAYLYNTPLGVSSIPSGTWTSNLYSYVSSTAAGRVSSLRSNIYSVIPYSLQDASTVTISGVAANTRTATASGGTPFAVCTADAVNAPNSITASMLQTPKGLYQIVACTDNAHVNIYVPTGYTNETTVAFSLWGLLFENQTATITQTVCCTLYSPASAQPAFTVTPLTKLGELMFATNAGGSTDVHYTHNGTSHYSNTQTPFAFAAQSAQARTAAITDIAPLTTDSGLILVLNPVTAVHLTRVFCATQGATSTASVNLDKRTEAAIGTPVGNLLGAGPTDLATTTAGANTSTWNAANCGGTASCPIAAHAPVVLTISATANTPTALNCSVDYTVD